MKFFSQLLTLFILASSINSVYAQEVDKLRLTYNEKNAASLQTGVTVSNDGKLIALAYENKTIKILNAVNGKVIKKLQGVHNKFFELRFNYNATKLISVGEKDNVVFIDIKSGETEKSFDLPKKITRVAVSKKEDYVAFGTLDADVYIYDLNTYNQITHIKRNKHHISGLDFDPNGDRIAIAIMASVRKTNTVTINDIKTGQVLDEIEKSSYMAVAYNKDGSKLFLSSIKGIAAKTLVDIYDLKSKTLKNVYTKLNGMSLTIYPSVEIFGDDILAVSIDKAFEVIDSRSGEKLYTTKREKTKGLQSFAKMGVDIKRIYPLYDNKSYLINYSNNNINQIYSTESKNIAAFIYSDSDEDLVVAARDGRMDGNSEAMADVFWSIRKSKKEIPLESTFDQFFTPSLLPLILSGSYELASDDAIDKAIEMSPLCSIISPDSISQVTNPNLSIRVSATPQGDNIKEIKVFVNGKRMNEGTRGFKKLTADGAFDITLISGRNIITAVAISESGYQSAPDKIVVDYKGASAESELYMLTIGVNAYRNPKYNLNYAKADATAFKESITEGGSSIFSSIKNYFIEDQEATKENILSAFEEISSTIGPEDVFVFYYAGHGVMSEEEKPLFYIIPYGVTQLYGNTDMLVDRAISANQLKKFSESIPAQKQLFVLDACQSGGMTDMLAMRGAAEEKAIAQLARSTGTYWITASNSDQFATEFAELGHGLFTYTILEGLSGKADGGSMDKKITVKELSSYLNDRVPELSEKHKGQPQFPTSYGFGQDFPVVIIKE